MSSRPIQPASRVYAGCSGWAYASWKPDFYPVKLSSKKLLEYYASRLNSVEVNYTFRSLPTRSMVDAWLAQTGPGFRFSFKAPQRITHMQRLRESSPALEKLADAIQPVAEAGRLGLILFQLPPNMRADTDRLAAFLRDAAALQLRLAFEFRHVSWFDESVYAILRDHQAALCVAESDDLQTPDVQTAPFSCYRLRRSGYSPEQLTAITDQLRRRAASDDVFAYFKHEEDPTGPLWAATVLAAIEEQAA